MKKEVMYNRFLVAILVFIFMIVIGAVVYHFLEGWSFFDSLYFTVITITTIGYGDFFPITVGGKIFTMIFPFIGIGMGFYLFSVVGRYIMHKTFTTINQSLEFTKNKVHSKK